MAVYALPQELENELPRFPNGQPYDDFVAAEEAFLVRLIAWAKAQAPAGEPHAGAVVRWPYADGYAQYLVVATRPVQLIHLPLGDAWDFPLAGRATKKDIVALIEQDKAWAALVARQEEKTGPAPLAAGERERAARK